MEFKYGQMVQNIKEIGNIIKLEVKENLNMLMEIFMKDNGNKIKQMDMEFISILMELNIKEIGKMIFRKDLENKHGLMEQNIKDNIYKGKKMVKENMFGRIFHNIQAIGNKIK